MAAFNPYSGMMLRIGSTKYELLAHQSASRSRADVFMMEGREAFLFKMRSQSDQSLWALKVMKPPYRGEYIALASIQVTRYKDLPGLFIGNRICLVKREYPELILQFPDLEYAVLMPWLSWNTWAEMLRTGEVSACYTRIQAIDLALATAHVLAGLEARKCAHTDVAGSNIVCAPDFKRIELLDIEGLYTLHASSPRRRRDGSSGYRHRRQKRQWCLEGDRFAGAVLLTEMLTWWNPFVRALTPPGAETLFHPEELQEIGSNRWQTARDVLWSFGPDVLYLFDQAWTSNSLAKCPDFNTWASRLGRVKASYLASTFEMGRNIRKR